MKTITLYIVSPAGGEETEYGRMEKFTEELNQFYRRFNNLQVELESYGMTLPVRKDGTYAVKVLQNSVMGHVKKSALCCVIFFCKKDEVAPDEMGIFVRSMTQLKKAEFAVYFKPNDDMQPVRNDITRRVVKIDEKLGVPREDRNRLSDMAKQYLNTGTNLERENRLQEAEGAYRESLVIQKKLSKADEETYLEALALPYHNLGTLYYRTNRLQEAEVMYTEALGIRKRLVELKGDQYQFLVAASQVNLGSLYAKMKRNEDAERCYLDALTVYEKLAEEKEDEFEPHLAMLSYNLGNVYRSMKLPEKARPYVEKAYAISSARKDSNSLCKQIYDAMNQNAKAVLQKQMEMAAALKKQGQELQGNGRYEDAVKSYQQAVSLYRTAEQEEYQVEAALLYTEMGLLNWDTNQLQEAEESYQAALDIYRKIAASNKKYLPDEAVASYNMGRFYQETRDEDVNDYLREAFELARECKDYNEQCRDIYENLEDEPLYEKTSEKEREEDKEEQSDMEEDTEINISSDTEIGDIGETEEKQTDKESAGGWLKKLFGRKK